MNSCIVNFHYIIVIAHNLCSYSTPNTHTHTQTLFSLIYLYVHVLVLLYTYRVPEKRAKLMTHSESMTSEIIKSHIVKEIRYMCTCIRTYSTCGSHRLQKNHAGHVNLLWVTSAALPWLPFP